MKIGELLIMNSLITEEQLEQALAQQAGTQKKVGEILVENESITDRQLVEALEFQLGIPVVNMNETAVDKQCIELIHVSIARKYGVLPIEIRGGKIKLAMIDPLNQEVIKEIQMATGMSVKPFIATKLEVEQAIIQHYGTTESIEELDAILLLAVEQNASDIYLDPEEDGYVVLFRIDHKLKKQKTITSTMQVSLIERIKKSANFKKTIQNIPQHGRMYKKIEKRDFDIVVSLLPTIRGESITLSLHEKFEVIKKVSELSFSEVNLPIIEEVIKHQTGFILISGPTESGKTVTMYSILNALQKKEHKIITIEESVAVQLDGIMQVEVNEQVGLTYAHGLRSVLRQNPNVVMIGDIRDMDTAEIALRASNDRLVIASIHSNSAVQSVQKLLQLGLDSYHLASTLRCVIGQKLIKRVCSKCAQTVAVTDEEFKYFEAVGLHHSDDQNVGSKNVLGNFRSFINAHISGKMTINRGDGCRLCNNTGYRGFIAVHEVLSIDEKLRDLISQRKSTAEFKLYLEHNGYKTMKYDGFLKARQGITTVEEVVQVVK